jgi:hypothetical protein
MKQITTLLLLLWTASTAHALQVLPTLNNINHIEISSSKLDAISITDTQKINQIVSFLNQYQSSWTIPKESKPEISLIFSFYSDQQHISDIGISAQFISQLYGKHWSQPIAKNIMKQFAGSTHPAIEENLFPIIPVDENSHNTYSQWEQKLNLLDTGINHRKIKSFLRKNNIRIKHVNNHASDNGYWLNLELSLVNDGSYVNTVIAAKMFLNKDHSLKSTQFLGYQLSKKPANTKRITSNVNAGNY